MLCTTAHEVCAAVRLTIGQPQTDECPTAIDLFTAAMNAGQPVGEITRRAMLVLTRAA